MNILSDEDLLAFVPPKSPELEVQSEQTLNALKDGIDKPKNDRNFEQRGFSSSDSEINMENDLEASKEAIPLSAERSQFDIVDKRPSRFGINKLINRMTGSSEALAEKIELETKHDEKKVEAKDTSEIPAFLRRQAN